MFLVCGKMCIDGGMEIQLMLEWLIDDFVLIVLYDEYICDGDWLILKFMFVLLWCWDQFILMWIEFGVLVVLIQCNCDWVEIVKYVVCLQVVSGYFIGLINGDGNYDILILFEDECCVIGLCLVVFVFGILFEDIQVLVMLVLQNYCMVFVYLWGSFLIYVQVVVLIWVEVFVWLWILCFYEELVQGFGFVNDSLMVCFLIFNDDEEFV